MAFGGCTTTFEDRADQDLLLDLLDTTPAYRGTVADAGLTCSLDVAADARLGTRAVLVWNGLRVRSPERLRPCV